MKAATGCIPQYGGVDGISIHAAREGGDKHVKPQPKQPDISIHAAREGGDCNAALAFGGFPISIHAAREGGDIHSFILMWINCHFNPRRP